MENEPVLTREVTVNLEAGLHMRPCTQIAHLARKATNCDLRIINGDHDVNARDMWDLLGLCAEFGTVLRLEARGVGAEQALMEMSELFEKNFPAIRVANSQADGSSN